MKKPSLLCDYLHEYAADEKWRLVAENHENISSAVVVPAYAEKESIFSTLVSLARNPVSFLEDTLIICVVNNKGNSPPADVKNNQDTLAMLKALIGRKRLGGYRADGDIYHFLTMLADSKIRLAYVDVSSPGYELPEKDGGVGMARKIGMDAALRLWTGDSLDTRLILSLDADTLVQNNYLSSIKHYFTKKVKTAIVAYEHQTPPDEETKAAIYCYEIFLRYWVLELQYAQSPYAYHSIGSTIVTTAEAYLEVRGMNKRQAGEDFYFLGKLAKLGKIGYVKETRVFPSARPSTRVPFGTGKGVRRFLSGGHREYPVYDPRVFFILKKWLELISRSTDSDAVQILAKTENIHPVLKKYLINCRFEMFWIQVRRRAKKEMLSRQFHHWFDAFKTLKLINYFTREEYPPVNIFMASRGIMSMAGRCDFDFSASGESPVLEEQLRILQYLRKIT